MRIIFAGTPANAAETLNALVTSGADVVGVLTRSDAPLGRTGSIAQSPVAAQADSHNIPVYKANTIDEQAMQWMRSLSPDLGVIVAYGSILRADTLAIPNHGWINVHYSLLPRFKGASPVQQAILEGEKVTGVTIFELDEGIDSGSILSAAQLQIPDEANAGSLLKALTAVGSNLLVETLNDFESLASGKTPQEPSQVNGQTRKLSRRDAKLDFSLPAAQLHNLVRAMNPEPMAWFEYDNAPVRLLASSVLEGKDSSQSVAQLVGSDLVVGCGQSGLILGLVQPAGKKPMSGADWFRGLRQESLLLS